MQVLLKKLLHFYSGYVKIEYRNFLTERVKSLGIFSFTRQNRMSLSDDWKIFADMFRHIGAFVYHEATQTAFFDENTQRILGVPRSLPKDEYQACLSKLREYPVPEEQNVYLFKTGAEKRCIRMQITCRTGEELGFIEEMTNRLAVISTDRTEYDMVTNMLNFQAFSSIIQRKLQNAETLCLTALRVTGLGKIADFSSAGDTNNCMASVAEVLHRFADENLIFSVRGFQEFYACFVNTDEQRILMQLEQIRQAVSACTISDNFGQSLQQEKHNHIDLHAGLAFYPAEGSSFRELLACAEFALFETRHDSHHAVIRFSADDFARRKDEYREEQLFDSILHENRLSYHFQPIVDAHTGAVAGYEILMRSEHFSPEQILTLAEKYGRLYEIEKATMFNAFQFLSQHQNSFSDRKLFINSVPSALLSESDFNELRITYEDLFEKTVVEIIEQSAASEEMFAILKNRCQEMKAQLALDDYGSGYSSTATLLKYMPRYVKIDMELITDICKNPQKQQLVSGIIDYAHENQIIVLAEGVENEADMKMLIRMGIDLLQGFYLAKPKPYLLEELTKEIRDVIINTNLEESAGVKKIYNVYHDETLDLVDLALQNYTDIHLYRHQVTIIGDPEKTIPMHIAVMDNHSCEVRFRNVHILSQDKPCISIGSYAQLTLIAEGDNSCNYMGIRVPEGAFFHLVGEGSFKVDSYSKFGYGIGGDYDSSYGCISLESTGTVEVICNSDRSIGIGGGMNPDDAEICLNAGSLHVTVGSPNALGIGCSEGNSLIYTSPDCKISLKVNGINSVGMGSMSGNTHVKCYSDVQFSGAGSKVIGIGVLNKGEGEIFTENAELAFHMRTNFGTCIGAIGGNVDVFTRNCKIRVNAEGGEITGIGDAKGSGDVTLEHTELKAYILATKSHEAGSKTGQFSMKGSSIIADVNDQQNIQETGE